MATSYTSLLGLALPVTGELSGTWGDTVNNAITSLLDTAVAGTTTLSTDADVTLTTTTGASNQARQAILLCSGARTAQRTITAPAQSKIYTVINATTGGFAVKVVGVGPTTGVTIVAGESAVIAWNGSDFTKISNTGGAGSFTDLTVSGSLTLSGGTANGVPYLNASKVLTSGSALTFDGSTFYANSNLSLSGAGTGNRYVALLNETSTYAGSLMLQAGGGSAAFGGGVTMYGASHASYPGAVWIGYSSGTTTGIIFGQGGNGVSAEQMRLTSTGLGIGTSSPGYKLDVNGVGRFSTGSDGVIVGPGTGTSTRANIYFAGTNSGGTSRVGYVGVNIWGTTGNLEFGNNIVGQAMTLDASGNLGLGVTPSAWNLGAGQAAFQFGRGSLFNNSANNTYLGANLYYDGSANRYIVSAAAAQYGLAYGEHQWYIAPSGTAGAAITFTQAMTLDSSGNLGIGTTSVSSAYGFGRSLGVSSSNAEIYVEGTSGKWSFGTDGNGNGYLQGPSPATSTDGSLVIKTRGTERARIDSSGNFIMATGSIQEHKSAIAASAIDMSTGNYFSKTISGTTTFTVSNVPSTGTAMSFILDLTNGGSATVNWWTGVKWAGGTAPTLTSAGRDVLGFFTYDGGTTWTGLVLGKDVK